MAITVRASTSLVGRILPEPGDDLTIVDEAEGAVREAGPVHLAVTNPVNASGARAEIAPERLVSPPLNAARGR